MTAAQEPEYIITESELKNLLMFIQHIQPETERIVWSVRSRPYNPQQERERVLAQKLPEGWLYTPLSPETWSLLSQYGDQENTPDECIKQALKIALDSSATGGILEKLETLSKSLRVLRLPVKADMVDEVISDLRSRGGGEG